ncbi:MAG: hypothetical protein M3O35_02655 [Acidobacteriota bacterium]|nr:hypothetical protein [Acidobacteriota bacterium]
MTVLAYLALGYSWRKNRFWLREDTSLNLFHTTTAGGDAWQPLRTHAIFAQPCEIGHFQGCQKAEDSEAVAQLRQGAVPASAKQLLDANHYSSAYHLLKELSLHHADGEVADLSANDAFDIESLANFANEWYLMPASEYAAAGREHDAVVLFRKFLAVVRPQVLRGHWLSYDGMDTTDIPAIADLFCVGRDRLTQDLCLLGILKAVNADDFAAEYGRLPEALRSDPLTAYLKLWKWDGSGALFWPPEAYTAPQQAAWFYSIGVVVRKAARALNDPTECAAALGSAAKAFGLSVEAQPHNGYFSQPASRQRTEVTEKALDLCQQPKK